MPYITTAERIGMEKGKVELLKLLLKQKFGNIDKETERLLNKASNRKAEKVANATFDIRSLEEVKEILRN